MDVLLAAVADVPIRFRMLIVGVPVTPHVPNAQIRYAIPTAISFAGIVHTAKYVSVAVLATVVADDDVISCPVRMLLRNVADSFWPATAAVDVTDPLLS